MRGLHTHDPAMQHALLHMATLPNKVQRYITRHSCILYKARLLQGQVVLSSDPEGELYASATSARVCTSSVTMRRMHKLPARLLMVSVLKTTVYILNSSIIVLTSS